MDQQGFDRIARVLGLAATRRAGIGAALALLTRSAASQPAAAAREEGTLPEPEGPCGNGSRKANVCTRNSQCCTGVCKTGLKNSDGKGRCRCLNAGASCSADENCCRDLACVAGACGAPCAPDVCKSGCAYRSVEEAWAALPAGSTINVAPGTYPTTITIDKSMTIVGCDAGVVLEIRNGVPFLMNGPGDRRVTLTLQRVTLDGRRIAGSQLLGSSTGAISFDVRDCTFRRGTYGIDTRGGGKVKIQGCEFRMIPGESIAITSERADVSASDSTFADSYAGIVLIDGDLTVDGCTFTGHSTFSVYRAHREESPVGIGSALVTNSTFTKIKGSALLLGWAEGTLDNVSVTGCTLRDGGGAVVLSDGTFTLSNTVISGNTNPGATSLLPGVGAGLAVFADNINTSVRLRSGVSITDNTAEKGAGITAVFAPPNRVRILGAPEAVKRNNGGPQCVRGDYETEVLTAIPGCDFSA